MTNAYEKHNSDQLPPEELSEREKALLQTQLDLERSKRWKKLAGPKPQPFITILRGKFWVLAILCGLLLAILGWQQGWFSSAAPKEPVVLAARADLLDYPFDNVTVRGGLTSPTIALPAKALEAYRKRDFETALREAGVSDHFFRGICWLQLGKSQNALAELEQVAPEGPGIGAEFYYYKGVALQDLGQKEAAKLAFQKILDSKTVRGNFRKEAESRLGN
jgi:tetratricopeptide (TPR) repeat protein